MISALRRFILLKLLKSEIDDVESEIRDLSLQRNIISLSNEDFMEVTNNIVELSAVKKNIVIIGKYLLSKKE